MLNIANKSSIGEQKYDSGANEYGQKYFGIYLKTPEIKNFQKFLLTEADSEPRI